MANGDPRKVTSRDAIPGPSPNACGSTVCSPPPPAAPLPIQNATDGAAKRHVAVYTCEITVGATASAKVGSHGATPTAQRANANQAAVMCASQAIRGPPTRAQGSKVESGLSVTIAWICASWAVLPFWPTPSGNPEAPAVVLRPHRYQTPCLQSHVVFTGI